MSSFFIYLFAGNTTGFLIEFFLLCQFASYINEKNTIKKKSVILLLCMSLLLGFSSSLFTVNQISTNGFFLFSNGLIMYYGIINIIQSLTLMAIFKNIPLTFLLLIVAIVSALADFASILTENSPLYTNTLDQYNTLLQNYLIRLPFLLLTLFVLYGFIWICKKTKSILMIKTLMIHPKACLLTAFTLIIFKLVNFRMSNDAHSASGNPNNYTLYLFLQFTGIIVIVLFMHSYASEIKRKELNVIMAQQSDYLIRLEDIQQKLRVINHDYKNVAAGLYLQAESGDIEAVKNYVTNQLLKLDKEIQAEMYQMNCLTNIKNLELKSLFFTKMLTASKRNVVIDLEVRKPIQSIPIPTDDLLRSLGILFDNAIESAEATPNHIVHIIISEEDDILTFLIKNHYVGEIVLNQIFKQGFSSKGNDRGLGLYSLKRILTKYPNVFLETKLDSDCFIQIIKIL